jgi:error-prone DNA polymerase
MPVELLARTHYSFLRGASRPEEMVRQAAASGLSALGLADLDGVYGLPKAFWVAKGLEKFKLIYGAELTLEGAPPLVLHAKTKAGWSLLCRLLTASHADKPKGEAGLPWERFVTMLESSPLKEGLLCLPLDPLIFGGDPGGEGCYPVLAELFGADLYLPLLRQVDGQDARRTARARELQRRYGWPVVATNQPHYHAPERRALQDALVCVREGVPLPEAGYRLFPNGERGLKSAEDLARLFEDWPETLRQGEAAAERCSFSLGELCYQYPGEWIPAGQTAQGYLGGLAEQGLAERFKTDVPSEVRAQLERELTLVGRLGFADYFLTIHEMMSFARARGILCQGRGSAANSILCYCLKITDVDPQKIDLLFERFISEERAEPPDIDVDFEHERREEVIQHLYDRYGRERAAMVSAVITYGSRSAVADLSKALGQPARVGRRLRGLREEELEAYGPHVARLAREIEGFPRHLSIHSGGFVLSGEPLIDLVPIEPARMTGRTIIQWDKYDLDYLKLMKVDVLGLGMLSALKRCLDSCKYPDLDSLPKEDPATYAMIQKADTLGVFQIESRAQMSMLGRLKPANFYDLVIEVAIVRPGPIVGQMVRPYLLRRQGREEPEYEGNEKLRAILEKTLGVPLFQEQVMRIATELGGFSPGESDELRRAIGAWRSDGRLEIIGQRLNAGLQAAGLSEGFRERLFKEIRGFADYGFPESHAASFALLVYASCYLKCHHPAEFAAALINSQPLGFYSNHSLVDDAKRHGVTVLLVDLNASDWDCQVDAGSLRLGLRVISGLSKAVAVGLIAQRQQQAFAGLEDVVRRAGLPLRVLQSLAMGDAFAPWGWSQREALWRLLELQVLRSGGARQGDLFSLLRAPEAEAGAFAGLSPWAAVQKDYHAYGLSTRAHPMQALRAWCKENGQNLGWTAAQARAQAHGAKGWAAGLVIVRQHPGTAKGVVFVTLEDESGLLDLVLWKEVYERYRLNALQEPYLRVWGELQRDGDALSFLVQRLQAIPLPPEAAAAGQRSHDWH